MSKGEEPEPNDLLELEELEDFETLPCNFTYVAVCILLPLLNGQLNAFHFSGFMLHFEEMGWPIFRAGLALSLGFGTRVFVQQLILNSGYWMAVPIGLVHLTSAILAIIYTTSEWAVFVEIVCAMGLDASCAVEGISFDSFGASEIQARQASSTALSVWTIGAAVAVTIGGMVYDTLGWRGVATYHTICQSSLVFLLLSQPGCRKSFMETFSLGDPTIQTESAKQTEAQDVKEGDFSRVMPARLALQGFVEEIKVEEVTDDEVGGAELGHVRQARVSTASKQSRRSAWSQTSQGHARPSVASKKSRQSAWSQRSKGSQGTHLTDGTKGTEDSKGTEVTMQTKITRKSLKTGATARTGKTAGTFLTQITSLSVAGKDFSCHFGAKNALQPVIAGATGQKKVARDELDDDTVEPVARASIPKDVRLPALLIVMNAFVNNCVYALEFCTFAIFFKQVHNWNEATWASVAQTSGDLVAAIAMQVVPHFFEGEYDPDEAGCFKRLWHKMTSQPYYLSFLLATWVLFNLGMLSPLLPLALVSQIFMGTTYTYSSKWTTEMNLFYSLGDQNVFMSLQVLCRNAEAIGGGLAGVIGTWLYTLNPLAPFIFTTGMSFLAFLMYTLGFCRRLGCDFDDIETAEQRRARRTGARRVSSWMSTRGTLQTGGTERSPDEELDAG